MINFLRFISILKKQNHVNTSKNVIAANSNSIHTKLKPDKEKVEKEIKRFLSDTPIEEAQTPPSSWYLDKDFYEYELEKVFKNNWIGLCSDHLLQKPGDYISGELINQPYIILKNQENKLNAFYNVCSHHASTICEGHGSSQDLECPYHGWAYNLDGVLTRCTSTKGMKNFKLKDYNLKKIDINNIGNILFLNFNKSKAEDSNNSFSKLISPFIECLKQNNLKENFSDLVFIKRKEYPMKCNWKVIIDNYCDGGYHVPFAHKALSTAIDLNTYHSVIYPKCSLQVANVSSSSDKRIGKSGPVVYCYLYPNIMFNRYGPWLDINMVIPVSETECVVIFEWFLEKKLADDKNFIISSLKNSDDVQQEDIWLGEHVMKGIKSDAYDKGRYVSMKEGPAYQFHQDLLGDLNED